MCSTPRLALLVCLGIFLLLLPTVAALAPLEGMDVPDRYPHEYLVSFHKGYTLAQHFGNIGRDLSDAPGFQEFGFGYSAQMDDRTLDAVRRDGGVEGVETNKPLYFDELEEVKLVETPQCVLDRYRNGQHRLV